MKKITALQISIVLSAFLLPTIILAQCDCSQPDPFNYVTISCNVASVNITGNDKTCFATSCSSNSPSYSYTIEFNSEKVTAYAIKVTGGNLIEETIVRGNSLPPVVLNSCSNSSQQISSNSNIYRIELKINWTTVSTNNCIVIWAYTGEIGNTPTSLSYFGKKSVITAIAPVAPTSISLSSPTNSSTCGWVIACNSVAGATKYCWSGAGTGCYSTIAGPTVSQNQYAFLCVNANNVCASSPYYCASIFTPRVCWNSMVEIDNTTESQIKIPENLSNKLLITPNPSNGFFTIEDIPIEVDAISIFSFDGKKIKSIEMKSRYKMTINMSYAPKGTYLIQFLKNNRNYITKKIILF